MENNLEVIGNESSVIFYNLNKQLCNVKKIILTKEIIIGSFENNKLGELFSKLETSKSEEEFAQILKDAKSEGVLDEHIKNDLYKSITENLGKVSQNVMDIKLKDFNFMSSVSNAKFNVTLRTSNFSITKYFEEKGQLISAIRYLIKEYLNLNLNKYRSSKISNFQIEIWESDDMYKHIFLKKEGNSLLLSSTYGFDLQHPIDYNIGCEFYISEGEDFTFYQNNQSIVKIREHGRLIESEMREQEKILTNDELVMINNATRNINDAIIEIVVNKKGAMKILNLSLPEMIANKKCEKGFVIYKSSNIYDKVAFVTLRDYLNEDQVNPSYLLIRNENELKELLLENIDFNKLDGIIFTKNTYNPFFEEIGSMFNIDIIFWSGPLSKSLETTINWEDFNIETQMSSSNSDANPFNQIIKDQNKEKDEFLERLKNIDLNTPTQRSDYASQRSDVGAIAQGLISSPNSSSANSGGNNMSIGNNFGNSSKKSAIGMLADAVLNQDSKPVKEEQKPVSNAGMQQNYVNEQTNNSYGNNFNSSSQNESNFSSMDDYFKEQSTSFESESQQTTNDNYMDFSNMPNPADQNENMVSQESTHVEKQKTLDVDRYMDVLATKILTSPSVNSGSYFVDMNNISEVQNGEIYYVTTDKNNISNPNMKYILPINVNESNLRDCYLLVNSANDYFLIDENQQGVKYFINLSHIDNSIKKKFIETTISKLNKVSFIIMKADLELLSEHINKVEEIFVKDLHDNSELSIVREKVLSMEKRFLMNKR